MAARRKPRACEKSSGDADAEPGFNPLFFGTAAALVLGVVIAASAGDATVLHSNLLFRAAVGGGVAAVLYAAVVALWLAYHHRTFKRLGVAGTSVEPGDAKTADEITERDLEVAEFMGTTTNAIDELRRRVEDLERSRE